MKQNQQVLSTLLKTIQMGQVDIRSVLDTTMRSSLRNTLKDQLQEYDSIETEAYTIALQRGWDLSELDPGRRFLRDRMTRMKLNGPNTDSRIADILIQRNTRGMILGLKNLRKAANIQPQVQALAQKIINRENMNIQKSQPFL